MNPVSPYLIPALIPPFLKNKKSLARGVLPFGRRLLPPAFNYSCWSPISSQLWRLEHTHTDKELCKCMCHVLLAVIFWVLCCVMVTGSISVIHRDCYCRLSQRLFISLSVWIIFFKEWTRIFLIPCFKACFSFLTFIYLSHITHLFFKHFWFPHLSFIFFSSLSIPDLCSPLFFIQVFFIPFNSVLCSLCVGHGVPSPSRLTHVVVLSQCYDNSVFGRVR